VSTSPEPTRARLAVIAAADLSFAKLLAAQLVAARAAGYEVHGVCTPGPRFAELQSLGVAMHGITIRRAISPLHDLITMWRIWRFLRRARIDVVHTHTPKASLLGQCAAWLAGVPVIVNTIHGFYFHEHMNRWTRRFYIVIEWIAARFSTHILCQNPEDVETALRLRICSAERISVLGNGVDIERFSPQRFDSAHREAMRRRLGIPGSTCVVCITARLVREKGYLELLEAMRSLLNSGLDVWLLAIGPVEPEKADRLDAGVFASSGIRERVTWVGARDDIPELLSCADIFALPSWREGLPRSAIEASAMGLPVVATRIRGCRQVVQPGTTGLLVKLRDVAELTAALRQLVSDAELRTRMGAAGRARAVAVFDERRICREVVSTYERGLAARRLRRCRR
jgi:glycosyltransferase involved in cell wall biosynthesis